MGANITARYFSSQDHSVIYCPVHPGDTLPMEDDAITLHRRARLRELISRRFGQQVDLLNYIQDRTDKRPNQGEMSALGRDNSGKSFREVKARNLEEAIGLPPGWFDMPLGSGFGPEYPTAAPVVPLVTTESTERANLLAELNHAAQHFGLNITVRY